MPIAGEANLLFLFLGCAPDTILSLIISNDISDKMASDAAAKAPARARKFFRPSASVRRKARFAPKNTLRYPRLDTILMVEDAIKNADDYMTKTQLWRSLKRKVMYQTFKIILDYLEHSGKIIYDKRDRAIIWIWNPGLAKRMEAHPELFYKSSQPAQRSR